MCMGSSQDDPVNNIRGGIFEINIDMATPANIEVLTTENIKVVHARFEQEIINN